MNIETTEDLCNQIADWIGVYGSCKGAEDNLEKENGCTNQNPLCCRTGFMMEMKQRMIDAVDNERKLEQIGLEPKEK